MEKILVSGEMRAGTTFLANFLNSQEDIVCYADFIRTPILFADKFKVDFNEQLSEREKNVLYSEFKAECNAVNIPFIKTLIAIALNHCGVLWISLLMNWPIFPKKHPKFVGLK